MAVTAPFGPIPWAVLPEMRKRNDPAVPESVNVVEFKIVIRLAVIRLVNLSAINAVELEPKADASFTPALFLNEILPLTQTGPAIVTTAELESSKSQFIFIGPIVTPVII